MWAAFREFARPIDDAEIPALGPHTLRAARAMAWLLLAVAPIYPLALPLLELATSTRGLVAAVVSIVVSAFAVLFSHSRIGTKRPMLAFFVSTWASQLTVWASAYAQELAHLEFVLTMLPYLAGFSVAFVPWRPRYSIAQSVPSTFLPVSIAVLLDLPLEVDPSVLAGSGFTVAIASRIMAIISSQRSKSCVTSAAR